MKIHLTDIKNETTIEAIQSITITPGFYAGVVSLSPVESGQCGLMLHCNYKAISVRIVIYHLSNLQLTTA